MKLSIKQRVLIFTIYLVVTYLLFAVLSNNWVIKADNNSVWFVSVIAYLLYYLFVTYFFVKPQDSLATSISTFFILLTLDISHAIDSLIIIRNIGIISSLAIICISIFNISIYKKDKFQNINATTYKLCQYLGTGELLFLPIILFCSLSFSMTIENLKIDHFLLLSSYWIFIVLARPVELLIHLFDRKKNKQTTSIGNIIRIDSPNLVRVELKNNIIWDESKNYISQISNDHWIRIIPIEKQIHSNCILGTGLYCDFTETDEMKLYKKVAHNEVFETIDYKNIRTAMLSDESYEDIEFLGIIIENTTISSAYIELTSKSSIEEGCIVFVELNKLRIYYQIIDGVTSEEVFTNNPKGKIIIKAYQLGYYSSENGFKKFGWIPSMNTPVFLINRDHGDLVCGPNEIGFVPNSKMALKVDFNNLVKYHTAILGVTGTGKTELAFDIIKHNISNGIKVFCVDFTGDYSVRLSELKPIMISLKKSTCDKLNNYIQSVETGKFGGSDEKKVLLEYLSELEPYIISQVESYIMSSDNLAIIELPEISNTRSTLKITEMYLSSLFNWAKNNRNVKTIQIVLEEAHTIIPENNLYKYDKVDTESVLGRLSQIALQGRKYNVGLLIISQRTALVSKTILSQCNTFFTFNLIDKTSLDFLSNVYSSEHVSSITNLKRLQMLAYGKAVYNERPVLIEVPFDESKEIASNLFQPIAIIDEIEDGFIIEEN